MASANLSMRACVTSTQSLTPISSPTSERISSKLVITRTRPSIRCDRSPA
jgi:hypothetical protein